MINQQELWMYMAVAYLFGAFTVAVFQWLEEEWFLIDEFFYKIKEWLKRK